MQKEQRKPTTRRESTVRRQSTARFEPCENTECYENLANAIVLLAVNDYKRRLHILLRRTGSFDNEDKDWEIEKLKRFFFSPWYGTLTEIDPELLVSRVKVMVKVEAKERMERELERQRKLEERQEREVNSLLLLLKRGAGCGKAALGDAVLAELRLLA